MKIKDINLSERPRERLLEVGPNNLSNEELISIILKTGTKNLSVKELSLNLLSEIKDINNLKDIRVNNLIKIKGIGIVKAIELIAAIELGRRVHYEKQIIKTKITNANSIYDYFKYLLNDQKQEHFYCIYLDNKKNIIDKKLLFIGTINMSIVHPREIFKEAYLLSASSIICLHNHPSGDVLPSNEDILITNKIKEIGNIQGINLLDHIIIGNNNYYSFFENNHFK